MSQFKYMLQALSVLILSWGIAEIGHASDPDTDDELGAYVRIQGALDENEEDEETLKELYNLLKEMKEDTENQFRARGLNPASNLSFAKAEEELNALAEENLDHVKAAPQSAAQESAKAQEEHMLKEMADTASLLCETLSAVVPPKKSD